MTGINLRSGGGLTSSLKLVSGTIGLLLLMFAVVAISIGSATTVWAQCQTYTLDGDFDLGTLLNLNHDAPGSDQLQLNANPTPFPFVNIACSQRGTTVRIDVNTGAILGEYFTAPNGWVAIHRERRSISWQRVAYQPRRIRGGQGSVTRIGLVIGGTRCDADGTPNAVGQYLAPPFAYSTCTDRDGDGLIKTSLGLGNILPGPTPRGRR